MRDFRYPWLWLGLWIADLIATVVVCVLPLPPVPSPIDHLDKLEHALGYAVLAAWAAMLFSTPRSRSLAALGLVALGISIEGLQGLVPWRSADVWDAVANLAGVVCGSALAFTPFARGLERVDAWIGRRAGGLRRRVPDQSTGVPNKRSPASPRPGKM